MKDMRDQHPGHSPPGLPSGVRQEAHKGGNAASSAMLKVARPNCAMRAKMDPRSAWGGEDSGARMCAGLTPHRRWSQTWIETDLDWKWSRAWPQSPPLPASGRGWGEGPLREFEPVERSPHPDPLPASGEREELCRAKCDYS